MRLPNLNSSHILNAQLQSLHEQLDPVLKLLFDLTKANHVFLSIWDENYCQVFNENKGFSSEEVIESSQLKIKFGSLFPEVVYIANSKYHTLIQDVSFFKKFEMDHHVFLLPLVNHEDGRIGILGLDMPLDRPFDFEEIVNQIECIGQYIQASYSKRLNNSSRTTFCKINLDNMPASFFNFSINRNAEILNCHFNKHMIENHPAFLDYSGNSFEKLESVLHLDLPSFRNMILRSDQDQSIEFVYPFVQRGQDNKYFLIKLHISLSDAGVYHCLGCINDISVHYSYSATLDQILFDISHVMRRPVVSMKGLTNLIDLNQFDRKELLEIAEKIKIVSDEMEDYIKAMFNTYEIKQN